MMDVKQDKLKERKYAVYTKTGRIYIDFDELYITQNDLSILFQVLQWFLLLTGTSILINNMLGNYK